MRHRLIVVAAFVVVAVFVAAGCSTASPTSGVAGTTVAGFEERSTAVGSIEVKARPIQVDGGGASFRVVLDTHAGSLDADMAAAAKLEVGGVSWPAVAWEGAPAGGHHREGTLRFAAAGSALGPVVLTVGGPGDPAVFTWTRA